MQKEKEIIAGALSSGYGFRLCDCLKFADKFYDRIFRVGNGVAVYCKLHDVTVDSIRKGNLKLNVPVNVWNLLHENGDNIHFIGICGCKLSDLLKLRRFKAKSFSWLSRDMKRFIYFKRG